jgi:hypothetical protein
LALDPVILGKIQPQREWVHEVFAEFFHWYVCIQLICWQ